MDVKMARVSCDSDELELQSRLFSRSTRPLVSICRSKPYGKTPMTDGLRLGAKPMVVGVEGIRPGPFKPNARLDVSVTLGATGPQAYPTTAPLMSLIFSYSLPPIWITAVEILCILQAT